MSKQIVNKCNNITVPTLNFDFSTIVLNQLPGCFTFFLRVHEHTYFMECALSQNVLLSLLMVHFVTRMYYYYRTMQMVQCAAKQLVFKQSGFVNVSCVNNSNSF